MRGGGVGEDEVWGRRRGGEEKGWGRRRSREEEGSLNLIRNYIIM